MKTILMINDLFDGKFDGDDAQKKVYNQFFPF